MNDIAEVLQRRQAAKLAAQRPAPVSDAELREFGIEEASPSAVPVEPMRSATRNSRTQHQVEKPLPQSLDAEKGIVSSIMQGGAKTMFVVERQVGANHFYHPQVAVVFEALQEMHSDNEPLNDLISLTDYLERTDRIQAAGGVGPVSELYMFVPGAGNVQYYIDIVLDKHALREIWKIGRELDIESVGQGKPVNDLIEDAMERLRALQSQSGRNGRLPDLDDMSALTGENRPPAPPELVRGLLHQGSKIIIGGTSKGRKTFALMDLAVSVATGSDWWGCETVEGKVCYINFEIQKPFFARRYEDICRAKGTTPRPGMFMSWTLRGMVEGMEKMSDQLIKSLVHHNFALIVVDPIYKALGDRDENKAGDVASLMNELERIAVRTGAAIAFGAHYSKGNQAAKESIDRIGGSGVFARDPDAILTMTAHESEECFTVDATLRNFPPKPPFVIGWKWPLFTLEETLDPAELKKPSRVTHAKADGKFEEQFSADDFLTLLHKNNNGKTPAEFKRIAREQLLCSESTFKRYWKKIKAGPYIEEKNGRYYVSKIYSPSVS